MLTDKLQESPVWLYTAIAAGAFFMSVFAYAAAEEWLTLKVEKSVASAERLLSVQLGSLTDAVVELRLDVHKQGDRHAREMEHLRKLLEGHVLHERAEN